MLPTVYIDELKLQHAGTAKEVLAERSEVSLKVYLCLLEWFGETRELNVVANDGHKPGVTADAFNRTTSRRIHNMFEVPTHQVF